MPVYDVAFTIETFKSTPEGQLKVSTVVHQGSGIVAVTDPAAIAIAARTIRTEVTDEVLGMAIVTLRKF